MKFVFVPGNTTRSGVFTRCWLEFLGTPVVVEPMKLLRKVLK